MRYLLGRRRRPEYPYSEAVREPFGILQILGNVLLERGPRSFQRVGDAVFDEAAHGERLYAPATSVLPNERGRTSPESVPTLTWR